MIVKWIGHKGLKVVTGLNVLPGLILETQEPQGTPGTQGTQYERRPSKTFLYECDELYRTVISLGKIPYLLTLT